MKLSTLIFLLSILIIGACETSTFNDTAEQGIYPEVDQSLWIYFERFEDEAAKRGIPINLKTLGITGVVENIQETNVAGTCQYGQHIAHVTIDLNFWQSSSFYNREFVVFHELGHCALKLNHNDLAFTNGICKSIMHSGLTNCRTAYNIENRDYYLDELFGIIQ
ncbi:MAG: hypothetical protein HKN09_08460 [Saprospiraceae bacterium]|nr:hypothetical protein [Saprospiraceae bacterium]